MEFHPIPDWDLERWYANEFTEAFPAVERKPLQEFTRLIGQGRYEMLGLYEGELLLGYAALWTCPNYPEFVLLDYLGVLANRRSGGLGSAILRHLGDRFAGKVVIAEAELPDPAASQVENDLRRRRLDFYRRNGFVPVYPAAACGVALQTMVLGPADNRDVLMEAHRAIYGPERPDAQIPLVEGAEPKLPYWMKEG